MTEVKVLTEALDHMDDQAILTEIMIKHVVHNAPTGDCQTIAVIFAKRGNSTVDDMKSIVEDGRNFLALLDTKDPSDEDKEKTVQYIDEIKRREELLNKKLAQLKDLIPVLKLMINYE